MGNKSLKISEENKDSILKSYSAKDPEHSNWYILNMKIIEKYSWK